MLPISSVQFHLPAIPSVADNVMQIQNNYDKDVYNRDFGFVTHIDQDEQEMTATFDEHVVT